jgi:D-alanyl-D-alanine carboxypeptidase
MFSPGLTQKRQLLTAFLTVIAGARVVNAAAPSTGTVPAAGSLAAVIASASKAGFEGVVLAGDRTAITFEQAVGFADRARRTPHSAKMVWRWASVSKQITAVIAAQLVAESKLDLDRPVSAYLDATEFGSAHAGLVTSRQLLQHTSGLPNPDVLPMFYERDVTAEAANRVAAAGACSATPVRTPGEQFEYNNCDYLVLGAVIEKITGRRLADVLVERITKPLNLTKGAVRPADKQDRAAQPVKGYEGKPLEPAFNLATYGAAGALLGSPRDLFAIDQALLGEALMSAEAKAQFWEGEPKLGYAALGVWSFPATLKGCSGPVQLIERRGGIGGVQVRNFLAPALGKVVVIFTNLAAWDFGEVWQGKGFSHEVLSAALCAG